MHAFWLVLTYDILEDRRIDDVIIKTFFCSYHILTSSVIYYWTDARQLGIYLLTLQQNNAYNNITCNKLLR